MKHCRLAGLPIDWKWLAAGCLFLVIAVAASHAEVSPNDSDDAGRFAVSVGAGFAADYLEHPNLKYSYSGSSYETTYTHLPAWDFKAFVDLTYIQVSAGFMFIDTTGYTRSTVNGQASAGNLEQAYTYVTLAAYLKYPFGIGSLRVFPLFGIQYRWNLTYIDNKTDVKNTLTSQQQADLSELWLGGGVGVDVSIGKNFFVRPELLIGMKLDSASDRDFAAALTNLGGTSISMRFLTAGVSLLAGYRF